MTENLKLNQNLNINRTVLVSDDTKNVQKPQVTRTPEYNARDEFVKVKRKRGLIAKTFDFFSNIFGTKLSRKKIESKIDDYEKGKIERAEVENLIDRYENKNFNNTEVTIDALSTISAIGVGSLAKKSGKLVEVFTKNYKTKMAVLGPVAAVVTGLVTKLGLEFIDGLVTPTDAKRKHSFATNTVTGTLDGISGAIATVSPLLLPVSIAVNAFSKYVNDKSDDKNNPTISDFLEKHKDSFGAEVLATIGVVAAGAKGHINFAKITDAISKVKLNKQYTSFYRPPKGQLTEFQSLARDIGYDLSIVLEGSKFKPTEILKLDEDFLKILLEKGQNGNITGKIKKIEEENIFLPKYLQTVVDIPDSGQKKIVEQIDMIVKGYNERKQHRLGRDFSWSWTTSSIDMTMEKLDKKGMDINGFKDLQQIISRIKSNCPTSRTMEEAQTMLDKNFDGYKLEKLLGVGSIAESYLAKDKNGNEVVIKIVKKHFLEGDKIAADKAKTVGKIHERRHGDYMKRTINSDERKEYDLNQLDSMYKVWGKEINLKEEAISAGEISSQASAFRAVDVVEAKNDIFIMKKAPGTNLDSSSLVTKWKDAGLEETDFKNFVENYVKVYCEQLFSLPKKGLKVVQSDPHGGNLLVELEKIKDLRTNKNATPITIIDYGNTTKTTREQAIKNLFNHIDYLIGNTDEIAKAMLENAQFGQNDKATMVKELSQALKDSIYNTDTKIDIDNPVKIFSTVNSFCLEFMQKKNIIPNASHINQMKAEETYILSNMGCLKNIAEACGYDISKAVDRNVIIKQLVGEMVKAVQDATKIAPKETASELAKRYRFFSKNPEEALSCLDINFNILSTNMQ